MSVELWEFQQRQTDLYDSVGEWVATCRDMHVAAAMLNGQFGGCFPDWEGVEHCSDEETSLIAAFNELLNGGKVVRMIDVLNAALTSLPNTSLSEEEK